MHFQKLKIISEIHGNAFAKSMIFFTVKHFLNAFPKPQNQNAFFFPGVHVLKSKYQLFAVIMSKYKLKCSLECTVFDIRVNICYLVLFEISILYILGRKSGLTTVLLKYFKTN
jgi:hypothetical protein